MIQKNSSTEVVKGEGVKLYTGLTNVLIKAINPTKDELIAMGYKTELEPVYTSKNDQGKNKIRLDFYVENTIDKFRSKLTFWLEDTNIVGSKSNKTQYIDKKGKTSWAFSVAELPDFVDKESARPSFSGEETLIDFISYWANTKTGDEVRLDTMQQIIAGNVKELKSLVKDLSTNGVKVLVGVKDNKYQEIYTKCFATPYQGNLNYWTKSLNDEYKQFNADYQGSFDWKEYKGTLVAPDTALAPSVTDDLPF